MDISPATLTPERMQALAGFLAAPERPAGTLCLDELHGFLFAIVCAPEPILPSEWLPVVFADQEPAFANETEAERILPILMGLYNEAVSQRSLTTSQTQLPEACRPRQPAMANFDDDAPLHRWSRGFIVGHLWLEETWDAYVPDALDEEFGAVLMVLSFFGNRRVAEEFTKEGDENRSLEEMAEQVAGMLDTAAAGYVAMGVTLAELAQDDMTYRPEPTHSTKTGRNQFCPCGSGKKYKRCCGAA